MLHLTESMKSSGAVDIYERLGKISAGKVLDVGTQNGGFIRTLIKSLNDYDSFVGIDITDKYFKKARENTDASKAVFEIMNAEHLEFDDDSFDTVCIAHSIHHLENPKEVLSEMIRVLKPGGYFILQEMFCDDDQTEAQMTDISVHHWSARVDAQRGIPHFETYSRQQLRDFVFSLDLNDIEIYEASRYVKCLFCEESEDCEDPMSEELLDFAIKEIDNLMEKMKDHPNYHEMNQEADVLRERVRSTGSKPASIMYFIGRK